MEVRQGLDYDDVLLVPKLSEVASRDEVELNSEFFNFYPIFSAPMKGISGYNLVKAFGEMNCLGILHRFDTVENRMKTVDKLARDSVPFAVAIGLDKAEVEFAKYATSRGSKLVCVDVANGYLSKVGEFTRYLYDTVGCYIMGGNVVTREGSDFLGQNGVLFVRVGIGGGGLCTTRNVTGVGLPQLSAIEDCNSSRNRDSYYLVSDGGIRNSGNAVKSFAFGADFVMIGTILGDTYESEHDGIIYGMASRKLQLEQGKEIKSVEGLEKPVEKTVSAKDLLTEFMGGIRSACTYLNCNDYKSIQYHSEFVYTGKGTLK